MSPKIRSDMATQYANYNIMNYLSFESNLV